MYKNIIYYNIIIIIFVGVPPRDRSLILPYDSGSRETSVRSLLLRRRRRDTAQNNNYYVYYTY